jgi:hypothetical protein
MIAIARLEEESPLEVLNSYWRPDLLRWRIGYLTELAN